ncbi:MAG: hypothetical protein RR945_11865 [Erysipelotrichaceae bacterium]
MNMTLQLPNNYLEIEEEEMMYLDGGARYYNMVQALISFLPGFGGSIYSCATAL